MHQALAVRRLERLGHLGGDSQRGIQGQCLARQPGGQGLAAEILHGDERPAVGLARFVDLADVGMVQRGGRLRLA